MKKILLFALSNVILICLFVLIWLDFDYKLPLKILATAFILFKIVEHYKPIK